MREMSRSAAAKLTVGITVLGVALLAFTGPGPTPAQAQAGSQTGATVTQTGWWNRTNAVPPSPVPGVTLPVVTVPAPPSVPEGTMAVSVTAGEIDKVTAVGITPEISRGVVSRAVLSVPEASAGEQIDNTGTGSVIVACPITSFWVGGANGEWKNVPPFDCATKVPGLRGADGVWTFDLTTVAAQWLSSGGTPSNGVVLVPEVATGTGATFQVVFGSDPAGIGVDLAATPPTATTPGSSVTSPPVTQGGSTSPAPTSSPTVTTAPVATTPETATTQPSAEPSPISAILGNFPGGVFLLVPVVVILALSLMIAFGPLGEPTLGVSREGGVSRALAARERAAPELEPSTRFAEAP